MPPLISYSVPAGVPSAWAAPASNSVANASVSFSFIVVLLRLVVPALQEPCSKRVEVIETVHVTFPDAKFAAELLTNNVQSHSHSEVKSGCSGSWPTGLAPQH